MPVAEFFSEFTGDRKKDVLIHHLSTHTSGLEDGAIRARSAEREKSFESTPCEATQNPDAHKRLCLGYDTPFSYETGTYMSYCNYGYEPLGMKDRYMIVPPSV
jgi:CubicO group peptidase (beta-lactamase class C family)